MKESQLQHIFEHEFIDKVFSGWEFPNRGSKRNDVQESTMWRFGITKNRKSVSVDIARIDPATNIAFYFELKPYFALGYKECGYLILGTALHRTYLKRTVNSYIVAPFEEESFPVSLEGDIIVDSFQLFTQATGLVIIKVGFADGHINKLHIIEDNIAKPLINLSIKKGFEHLICTECKLSSQQK